MKPDQAVSGLRLEIKPDETILVNGASIRFTHRTTFFILNKDARVLRGNMVMTREEATTQAKEMYLRVQNLYMSSRTEEEQSLAGISLEQFQAPEGLTEVWNEVIRAIRSNRWFAALRIMHRRIKAHDVG